MEMCIKLHQGISLVRTTDGNSMTCWPSLRRETVTSLNRVLEP